MKVNTCAHETSLEGLVGREGEGFLGAAIACEASPRGNPSGLPWSDPIRTPMIIFIIIVSE